MNSELHFQLRIPIGEDEGDDDKKEIIYPKTKLSKLSHCASDHLCILCKCHIQLVYFSIFCSLRVYADIYTLNKHYGTLINHMVLL